MDIYKSVKIRVKIGREWHWQSARSPSNVIFFSRSEDMHQHDCFEKLEDPGHCWPYGPSSYTGANIKGNVVKPTKLQNPDCCIRTNSTSLLISIDLTSHMTFGTRRVCMNAIGTAYLISLEVLSFRMDLLWTHLVRRWSAYFHRTVTRLSITFSTSTPAFH